MDSKTLVQWPLATVLFAVYAAGTSRADVNEVRSLFESILSEPGGVAQLSPADFSVQLDSLRGAPADQVKSLLPLGQQCLKSSSPAIRGYGIALFMVVGMRPDSIGLVDPYIEEVAPLLDDASVGMRNGAIFVLGSGNPGPGSKSLAYLSAHLYSSNNSDDQARRIGAALLRGQSADPGVVRSVLQLAEQRPALRAALIQMLGLYSVTTEEALRFIRTGLSDQNADTRRIAVDTVERLPKSARSLFTADLQRLIADPNEVAEVRSRALQAFAK